MRSKKYKTKKLNYKVSETPKKNPKKDMRRYSTVFFLIGLNLMLGLAYYGFTYTTWMYPETSNGTTTTTTTTQSATSTITTEEQPILQIDPEAIEEAVNTEAYTHAIWPGFKGDKNDGLAVRKHFQKNLGQYIINNGTVPIDGVYTIHFYYVVTDDGRILYYGIVKDGRTSPKIPKVIVQETQQLISIGVPGIISGTDVNGDNITVIYEMVITFKTNGL